MFTRLLNYLQYYILRENNENNLYNIVTNHLIDDDEHMGALLGKSCSGSFRQI